MSNGWNFWDYTENSKLKSPPKARFVRLRSTNKNKCRFSEIEIEGIVFYKTD